MSEEGTLIQSEEESRQASSASAGVPQAPGYSLEVRLGAGSFGEVWAGEQLRTGQRVAVKVLHDWVNVTLLAREVERLREVSEHPNVVTLLDAELMAFPRFLVMPCLERSVADCQGATVSQVVDWLRQAATGLRYCHDKGVLHCDLKPANLLLDAEGQIRLADFGQALRSGEVSQAMGSLGYMAPEQLAWAVHKAGSPDRSWDIYALGALAYVLLCGQLPRLTPEQISSLTGAGTQRLSQYAELLGTQPLVGLRRLNRRVDRDLAAIVEACLERDPSHRLAGATALLEELERRERRLPVHSRRPAQIWVKSLFSKGKVLSSPPSQWVYEAYRAKRWIQRNRALSAVCLLGTGILLATTFVETDPYLPFAELPPGAPVKVPVESREARLGPIYARGMEGWDPGQSPNDPALLFSMSQLLSYPPAIPSTAARALERYHKGKALRWLRIAREAQESAPVADPVHSGPVLLWNLGCWEVCYLVHCRDYRAALARYWDLLYMHRHYPLRPGNLAELLGLWRLVGRLLLTVPTNDLQAFHQGLQDLKPPPPDFDAMVGSTDERRWQMEEAGHPFNPNAPLLHQWHEAHNGVHRAWESSLLRSDFAQLYRDTVGLGPGEIQPVVHFFHPIKELVRSISAIQAQSLYPNVITDLYWRMRFDALRIEVASELYRRSHGQPPQSLQELVPGLLEGLPPDYFQGGALRLQADCITTRLPYHGQGGSIQDPFFQPGLTTLTARTGGSLTLLEPPAVGLPLY